MSTEGIPSIETLMRQIRTAEEPNPTQQASSLVAAIQSEVQRRIASAKAEFDAQVKIAMEECNAIQASDLVTIRGQDGEEVFFRRGESGDMKQTVDWLIAHGWIPVGLPGQP